MGTTDKRLLFAALANCGRERRVRLARPSNTRSRELTLDRSSTRGTVPCFPDGANRHTDGHCRRTRCRHTRPGRSGVPSLFPHATRRSGSNGCLDARTSGSVPRFDGGCRWKVDDSMPRLALLMWKTNGGDTSLVYPPPVLEHLRPRRDIGRTPRYCPPLNCPSCRSCRRHGFHGHSINGTARTPRGEVVEAVNASTNRRRLDSRVDDATRTLSAWECRPAPTSVRTDFVTGG